MSSAILQSPTLNASGVVFAGGPFIAIGYSDEIGWTHTDNTIQNTNLYELTLNPDGTYNFGGIPLPLLPRTDTIKIRQADGSLTSQNIEILSSVHGPIVAPPNTTNPNKALALRVAGLQQPSLVTQYWKMIQAHNLDEFIAANSALQMPFFNVIYADRDGHILYVFGGQQPVRHGGDWGKYSGILDGSDRSLLWTDTFAWSIFHARSIPLVASLPTATIRPGPRPSPGLAPNRSRPLSRVCLAAVHGLAGTARRGPSAVEGESDTYGYTLRQGVDAYAARRSRAAGPHQCRQSIRQRYRPARRRDARGMEPRRWRPQQGRGAVRGMVGPRQQRSESGEGQYDQLLLAPPAFLDGWSASDPLNTPDGLANAAGAVLDLIVAAQQVVAAYCALDAAWGDVHRIVLATHDPTFQQTILVSNDPQSGADDPFGPVRVIFGFRHLMGATSSGLTAVTATCSSSNSQKKGPKQALCLAMGMRRGLVRPT